MNDLKNKVFDNLDKLVITVLIVITISLGIVNSNNRKYINTLKVLNRKSKEENRDLNIKLMGLNKIIREKDLQDNIDILGWHPDKELELLLSMNPDNYKSKKEMIIEEEGENILRKHLRSLVDDLLYVESFILERRDEEYEIEYSEEGYGIYDLLFFIDYRELEKLKNNDYGKYLEVIEELDNRGVARY